MQQLKVNEIDMNYILINKYLAGEASENEVKEVFRWIDTDLNNKKEFIQYKKIWTLTARSSENSDKSWIFIMSKIKRMKNKFIISPVFMRYAAMFILVLSIGMMLQYVVFERTNDNIYSDKTCIEVPAGQMSNVVLCDGTTVQLNSGSKLIYSNSFNSGNRWVKLEGEAFFVVKKDAEHPFLIKTESLDFKVYGTSFNVQAYGVDNEVNTTLIEGSLGVINKNGNELVRLVPGENVRYEKVTKKLNVSIVEIDLYTSWKDGIITFKNERFKDIAGKIERWYNVKIIIKNPKLENELYMGTIMKNKPVDQILKVLSLTSSLNYCIVSRPDKPDIIYWK